MIDKFLLMWWRCFCGYFLFHNPGKFGKFAEFLFPLFFSRNLIGCGLFDGSAWRWEILLNWWLYFYSNMETWKSQATVLNVNKSIYIFWCDWKYHHALSLEHVAIWSEIMFGRLRSTRWTFMEDAPRKPTAIRILHSHQWREHFVSPFFLKKNEGSDNSFIYILASDITITLTPSSRTKKVQLKVQRVFLPPSNHYVWWAACLSAQLPPWYRL